jgi:hypothetical protein
MDPLSRVRVADWPQGAAAPLNLMVDDLADVFVELPGYRRREKDWGHLTDGPGSLWRFIECELLARVPGLKISFFVPVNRRPLVEPAPTGSYYGPIDARPQMREFLRGLDAHPRIELAYHGKDHFRGGGPARVQEWLGYTSVAEAVAETERGLEIFERAVGRRPVGGKYPGYASNEHSDESIAACGFRWWCRRFNRGRIQDADTPTEELAPRWFGGGDVLDLPSTLGGNLFPPWLCSEWIKWPKRWFQRRSLRAVGRAQVSRLVEAGLPLTVQEHTAPSRADGRRQGGNIQDDLSGLRFLLGECLRRPVWHAHPSEIADHLRLRLACTIEVDGAGGLRIRPPALDRLGELYLSVDEGVAALVAPDGRRYEAGTAHGRRVVALPVAAGDYRIEESGR